MQATRKAYEEVDEELKGSGAEPSQGFLRSITPHYILQTYYPSSDRIKNARTLDYIARAESDKPLLISMKRWGLGMDKRHSYVWNYLVDLDSNTLDIFLDYEEKKTAPRSRFHELELEAWKVQRAPRSLTSLSLAYGKSPMTERGLFNQIQRALEGRGRKWRTKRGSYFL